MRTGDAMIPTIDAYPACPTCSTAFVFRRAYSLSGVVWVWQRDCSHKKAEPVLVECRES